MVLNCLPTIYVTDLVLLALRLLRQDLKELTDSIEPVEPWDEGYG